MLHGVTIKESSAQKDELILEGNDIQNVSQSGTPIPSCMAHYYILTYLYFNSRLDPGHVPCTKQGYP
jgi:hypothetical protein